nr:unnamed protein product [Callosobruchus analis]
MCPYNPAHYILRKRMNTHLVKCKRSYPESKLVECDFNMLHKVPEPELRYHHDNCPDRKKIEVTVYQEEGADLNKYPIKTEAVPTEESWDDLNVPTYDPKKHCETKNVIRHLDVASAAKRREFRMQERKRIGLLNANQESKCDSDRPKENIRNTSNVQKPSFVLPERPQNRIDEEVPQSVAALVQRLAIDAKKAVIPKRKTTN